MSMNDWSEGYVTEVEYVPGFYRDMAPSVIELCALLRGHESPSASKPYNYLEIGCGQGVTSALLAAANPHARFYAIDFNPLHVSNARDLARAGGLDNVEFFEDSFAEALGRDLPQMDFIALHGVYSWITPENRAQVVSLLKQFLKPGGLAYVSYNCLPGWAGKAPVRKLMTEHAASHRGGIIERFAAARDFVAELKKTDCAYFRMHPTAGDLVDKISGQSSNYLVHEYLNEAWELLYHSDVVREMHGAKLSYVGSATIMENFDEASTPPGLRPLLAQEKDPVMQELLRDFGANRQFRRDLFGRGAGRLPAQEAIARFGAMRFALTRPRADCKPEVKLPLGNGRLQQPVFDALLEGLADGPKSASELARAAGRPVADARFMIGAMYDAGYIHPLLAQDPPLVPAQRFNQAMLRRVLQGRELQALASPCCGSASGLSVVDQFFLLAYSEKAPDPALFAHEHLFASGRRVKDEQGKPVMEAERHLGLLREIEAKFRPDILPICRSLGILA